MIRRYMTHQPVSLVLIAALLALLLAAFAVERQIGAQGVQPARWDATGIVTAVFAPLAVDIQQTGQPVTRSIKAVPGRAPVAPKASARNSFDQRSKPATSQCPTNPGRDVGCSAP
jgi:hypothetical protein